MLFVISLVGYGLGPLTIGFLSDMFAQAHIAASPYASDLTLTLCKGADTLKTLGAAKAAACNAATGEGLRSSMSTVILLFTIASICFFAASRSLKRDIVSKMH